MHGVGAREESYMHGASRICAVTEDFDALTLGRQHFAESEPQVCLPCMRDARMKVARHMMRFSSLWVFVEPLSDVGHATNEYIFMSLYIYIYI